MCRSRLSKCRNFSDNLLVIVIVSHNFSFVTRSHTVHINCLGYWMTVVAWVVHNCLVFKPNIAPENAHVSKNCSVCLISEKYLECEGCHSRLVETFWWERGGECMVCRCLWTYGHTELHEDPCYGSVLFCATFLSLCLFGWVTSGVVVYPVSFVLFI